MKSNKKIPKIVKKVAISKINAFLLEDTQELH